jgi:hypothetical protein
LRATYRYNGTLRLKNSGAVRNKISLALLFTLHNALLAEFSFALFLRKHFTNILLNQLKYKI